MCVDVVHASVQMMKKLRDSIPLKRALCGIPSTEVLNAALTAYRYIEEPIREMLQNIPATGEWVSERVSE